MNLLLTGATGLIGKRFAELAPKDIDITPYPRKGIINEGFFDYVVHAAGYAQPEKFLANKLATLKVNTILTFKLFERLKTGGTFLYLSSSEVYNGAQPPHTEDSIGTTTPQHPRACYIEGKRCGEAICMANADFHTVKIARIALTYGKTHESDTRALNQFIASGRRGSIQLLDDGSAKRTYLFVDDAVRMLWNILLFGKETVYNVGGVSETTIWELALRIGRMFGADVKKGSTPLSGAPRAVKLDITRYCNEFGTPEFTTLEDGLRTMI